MQTTDFEPFTGHSIFGIVADTKLNVNAGKTLEELLLEAGINEYTNDFFLAVAHWGLRERAVLTFFREMGGMFSEWQNKAIEKGFDHSYYSLEVDEWDGDRTRYPVNQLMEKNRSFDKVRAYQCAAALGGYTHDVRQPKPSEKPPAFSDIKNRDAQGIQYLFLNWLCLECFRWNFSSFRDVVILRQVVSETARSTLRSTEWRAVIANRLGDIDYKTYSDDLLGLLIKLLILNWIEIKTGKVNAMDLLNDVMDVDKYLKRAGAVPKLFDQNLGDKWNAGIEAFIQRQEEKVQVFKTDPEFENNHTERMNTYFLAEWDFTNTRADIRRPAKFFEDNDIKNLNIPNQSMSDLLRQLF